jgi:hypothetical protein
MAGTEFTFLSEPASNDSETPVTFIFEETYPPENVSGLPWTQIKVEESEGRDGPWTQIDSQSIPPIVVDPQEPIAQTVITNFGTKIKAWYRLIWVNSASESSVGDQKYNTTLATASTEIQKLVKGTMPTTWDRLVRSPIYGIEVLEEKIQMAKYLVLPEALASAPEASYSFLLKNYVSKVAALEIIPAAIDYWMSEKVTVSNTGTNETVSYADRTIPLRELASYLMKEIARLKPLIGKEIQSTAPDGTGPAISQAGPLVTSNPWDWQPAFDNSAQDNGDSSVIA